MWLRRDIKYHKLQFYRRSIIVKFIVLITIGPILTIWMVHKSHLSDFHSDILSRILNGKTLKEIAYEHEIQIDLSKQTPGFCNNGVECFLNAEDVESGDESYIKNGINVVLSDRISYNRTPPYVQHELCKNFHYDIMSLPSASVIITFYEEPYSILLRTVHSILNTVPSSILKEIILVDDFSSHYDLKGKLEYYVKTRLSEKVKLLRMKKQ